MSVFNFFKRALGFDGDEEDYVDDADNGYSAQSDSGSESNETLEVTEVRLEAPKIDPAMKARIFERVVAVFNEALPDFLKSTVNQEAQMQRLASSLDSSCNEYLDSLLNQAQAYAEARLKNAADVARKESARLKEEMETVNRARNNMREQQLSADRRNRALTDRVRDLEEQLSRMEAEREQFQLENKSLINKLKVADVQPGIVDELTREVEVLRARLKDGVQESVSRVEIDSVEIEQLRAQVDSLVAANSVLKDEKDILVAEKEALEKEYKGMADSYENASKRCEMQEAMYSDLQQTLAQTRSELEQLRSDGAAAAEKSNAELEEAHEVLKNFAKLEKQFEEVAKVIQKRDDIIARLKAEKKKLKADLDEAEQKLLSSSGEHSEGLFGFSSEPVPDYDEPVAEPLQDDDFEVPDWFVTEPAPVPKESDPSFGYQEPARKAKHPDNDSQLTLF